MIPNNDETLLLARRVNDMLKSYMAVQDALFKPSLRKILRIPGIYRPVDYEGNLRTLSALLKDLAAIKTAIRHEDRDAANPEGKFLGVLRGYVSLMFSAVEKLSCICGRLHERSRGGTYGKEEYRGDMTELREIQKKHLASGVVLNEMIRKFMKHDAPSIRKDERNDV